MEERVEYRIAWEHYFWEEWHTCLSDDDYDTFEEAVEALAMENISNNTNIMNMRVVKITTVREDVYFK